MALAEILKCHSEKQAAQLVKEFLPSCNIGATHNKGENLPGILWVEHNQEPYNLDLALNLLDGEGEVTITINKYSTTINFPTCFPDKIANSANKNEWCQPLSVFLPSLFKKLISSQSKSKNKTISQACDLLALNLKRGHPHGYPELTSSEEFQKLIYLIEMPYTINMHAIDTGEEGIEGPLGSLTESGNAMFISVPSQFTNPPETLDEMAALGIINGRGNLLLTKSIGRYPKDQVPDNEIYLKMLETADNLPYESPSMTRIWFSPAQPHFVYKVESRKLDWGNKSQILLWSNSNPSYIVPVVTSDQIAFIGDHVPIGFQSRFDYDPT